MTSSGKQAAVIAAALKAQGCEVKAPDGVRYVEYEVYTNLGGLSVMITIWPRRSGWLHFMVNTDECVEGLEFTVNGDTRSTDVFGVTLGPCLPASEHGKVTLEFEGRRKELTW